MEGPVAPHGQSGETGQSGQIVCFETFRRERERRQARVLPYLAPTRGRRPRSPFGGNQLTRREIDHRRRMLGHLSEAPRRAETGPRKPGMTGSIGDDHPQRPAVVVQDVVIDPKKQSPVPADSERTLLAADEEDIAFADAAD